MDWITAILNFFAGLFGILPKAPTAEAKAEATGEAGGAAKVQAANATEALHEVERAQQGSTDAAAARTADPDRLQRDGADVRPYSPGGHD